MSELLPCMVLGYSAAACFTGGYSLDLLLNLHPNLHSMASHRFHLLRPVIKQSVGGVRGSLNTAVSVDLGAVIRRDHKSLSPSPPPFLLPRTAERLTPLEMAKIAPDIFVEE